MTTLTPMIAAARQREARRSWDLIPDEDAPIRSIVMRFASREAAHHVLTLAGYFPIGASGHLLRHFDGRMAVRYSHPDGSTVVLAQPFVERRGSAVATVGG